jgi:hypothetical protein
MLGLLGAFGFMVALMLDIGEGTMSWETIPMI